MRILRRAGVGALVSLIPGAAGAQQERGAFVATLGTDTVAVERFTRSRDRIEGDVLMRAPRARVVHYVATLTPAGTVSRYELAVRPLTPGGPVSFSNAVMVITGDSARVTLTRNGRDTTMAMAGARGGVPMIGAGWAMYEQALRQAAAAGRDSTPVTLLFPGAPTPQTTKVVREGDSVRVDYFGDPAYALLDRTGRLTRWQGLRTTNKVIVERLPDVDLAPLERAFAQREATAGPAGQLSPRDTVRATVGRAHLLVDYGRPMKRGRAIFGGIVPWNAVWRTGANAATQFTTDADLVVGGQPIPAGTYTLWTVPSREGSKLIFNKQTGQWGTEYDAAQDLVRVNLATESARSPAEQFTIAVEPRGAGGVLRFVWDTTQLSVPFTVKP
ncbi:MAG TPA: DUF2911 domain-containing protein [Gemmatimonadaceae bacterium]|nr:DUF2911 domain-containing protein [Gemmatimonadaceae bacterium]